MKRLFPSVTTRTGDTGLSADRSGERTRKDAPVFRALGALDELNSFIGVAKHHVADPSGLLAAQRTLLEIGSLVATDPITSPELYYKLPPFGVDRIDALEAWQERLMETTPIAREFVPPGGTPASAHVDVARAVCRRAERELVGFAFDTPRPDLELCLRWLNRLSDVLFVLARHAERPMPAA